MKFHLRGNPVSISGYLTASTGEHAAGSIGGMIRMGGMVLSFMAVGSAILYALSHAAPIVAAIWGVFIWKEFAGSDKRTKQLLGGIFLFYQLGLILIVIFKLV